jgi:hypothetical protein
VTGWRTTRCAYRNNNNPNNHNDNNGFRLVASHIFLRLPEVWRGHGCAAEVQKMARSSSWPSFTPDR